MSPFSFVSKSSVSTLGRGGGRRKGAPARKPPRNRLGVEALEVRSLLSANVVQSNLVSDLPGVAQVQDPNLVNPWGISESSTSPFWISDNNTGVSTLYAVPGATNTTVEVYPGQTFRIPANLATNVSVNAATHGHRIAGVIFKNPTPFPPAPRSRAGTRAASARESPCGGGRHDPTSTRN